MWIERPARVRADHSERDIADGTGRKAWVGDITIEGETIVEIWPQYRRLSHREIDVEGALVTPGFVDVHTHYDAQATWDPELTPSGWHGGTTAVRGNGGVGFAPAAAERRQWRIELMEGIEDIPVRRSPTASSGNGRSCTNTPRRARAS